jgi:hypothetical protein
MRKVVIDDKPASWIIVRTKLDQEISRDIDHDLDRPYCCDKFTG